MITKILLTALLVGTGLSFGAEQAGQTGATDPVVRTGRTPRVTVVEIRLSSGSQLPAAAALLAHIRAHPTPTPEELIVYNQLRADYAREVAASRELQVARPDQVDGAGDGAGSN